MKWIDNKVVVLFLSLALLVLGNTESFLLKVPENFPVKSTAQEDSQFPLRISLEHSNNAKVTVGMDVSVKRSAFIELRHLQVGETYQVKICWSALDPISIEDMEWLIVPHSTNFEGTISDDARIFVQFTVTNDSYPPLKPGIVEYINVSVINCKLGVPVDLYEIIVYIAIIMASVVFLTGKINLCEMIRR